jgi:UDPglucose 6-dehydrogenase
MIHRAGAEAIVHDPIALPGVVKKHPELTTQEDLSQAFGGVDAVVLATEWAEYRKLEPSTINGLSNKFIIDGRNVLDVSKWQAAGWRVIALGRNVHNG